MTEIEKLTGSLSTEVVSQLFQGGWFGNLVAQCWGKAKCSRGHVEGVCSLSSNGSCSPAIKLVQPSVVSYPGLHLKFLN